MVGDYLFDVRGAALLSISQVVNKGACCYHALIHVLATESHQGSDTQLFFENGFASSNFCD